ncbi:hypothetical protein E9549_08080 [Blastococcus sp. MG754426]|uniref:hypothetical protein n=1 Tax=unclassified Blastococcus TaxID=2619396 RepID=UPI001EF1581C|nr:MULTISPECIES: hypothetical protein [unclassified Blastococcus]MCF6507364.1 hypothetical protein [Blastococcus sp. MG754426]MCF6511436.1 hypothetical protein [Blastococcus sp. MG754427]MCF6736293.1 hypothetical protein [Blastococcus sp. KM273129]
MLDTPATARPARVDRWRRPVLALAVLALLFWAASYSWVLGFTPPTRWLSATASPWGLMEVAALATGATALAGGVVLARRGTGHTRHTGIRVLRLAGFALVATTVGMLVSF